jgi:UDP-glucose 4-epimerase
MKITVTGGAGFIGSHIVDRLVANEEEIVIIDTLQTGSAKNISRKAGLVKKILRTGK